MESKRILQWVERRPHKGSPMSKKPEIFTLARTHAVLAGLSVGVIAQVTSANIVSESLFFAVLLFAASILLNGAGYFLEACPGLRRPASAQGARLLICGHGFAVGSFLVAMAFVVGHFSLVAGTAFGIASVVLMLLAVKVTPTPAEQCDRIVAELEAGRRAHRAACDRIKEEINTVEAEVTAIEQEQAELNQELAQIDIALAGDMTEEDKAAVRTRAVEVQSRFVAVCGLIDRARERVGPLNHELRRSEEVDRKYFKWSGRKLKQLRVVIKSGHPLYPKLADPYRSND